MENEDMFMEYFIENFESFLKEPIVDEWYIADFAQKYIKPLECWQAFCILKWFTNYMIDQYNEKFEYEMVEIFRHLKNQTETNECFYSQTQKKRILELYKEEYCQEVVNQVFHKRI